MRFRDRRSILTALVLTAGYLALALAVLIVLLGPFADYQPKSAGPVLSILLLINAAMLVWRLIMRAGFTTSRYGWREGLRAIPRSVISNIVAIASARKALTGYMFANPNASPRWDKTAHIFPSETAKR